MPRNFKKGLSALKHGGYSTNVLPGESADEFEALHRELISEWRPSGAFEQDEVANLARLLWRRKNLGSFRLAELAQCRMRQIREAMVSAIDLPKSAQSAEFEKSLDRNLRAAETKARKELGKELYVLAQAGEQATLEHLMKELAVQERLDGMIQRCFKNLMLAKGLKSMDVASTTAAPQLLPKPPNPA
jgi:hypothetical protein